MKPSNKSRDLTTGSLSMHIRKLAIPASIGYFFHTMYNVVDTYYAGSISTVALAAMSIGFPVFLLIIAFSQGVSSGASSLISNALGAKKDEEAKIYSMQAISFAFFVAVFLTFSGPFLTRYLFTEVFEAKGEYLDLAILYMNTIFFGSVFFLMENIANSILVAHGDSTKYRNVLIASFFLNILLDPFFLYGGPKIPFTDYQWQWFPAQGLQGIAFATILIIALGCVYMFYQVIKSGYLKGCQISCMIPRTKYYLEIARMGFPSAISMMNVAAGFIIINLFVEKFGEEAVAAYGAGLRIEQIILLPSIGLNIACLAIVGQNNGAEKFQRMKTALHKLYKYGLTVIFIGAVFQFIFAPYWLQIFTDDPKVLDIGTYYLRVAACIEWTYVVMSISLAALQGMKRPFYAMFLGIFRQLVLPLIVFNIVLNYYELEITSLWWSIAGITSFSALITYFYVRYVLNTLPKERDEAQTQKL